jgi:hypothetical protein
MLKYEDGTPASTPQMASDVATFLDFIENAHYPDAKVQIYMIWMACLIWFPISWVYVKYHEFTHHSCMLYIFK